MKKLLDIIHEIDKEMNPENFTDSQKAYAMIAAIAENIDNKNTGSDHLDVIVATQELVSKEKAQKAQQREEDLAFRQQLIKELKSIVFAINNRH